MRELENQFENTVVFASQSGKMTGELTRDWISKVLLPAVCTRIKSIGTDTDIASQAETMSVDDVFEASKTNIIRAMDLTCQKALVVTGTAIVLEMRNLPIWNLHRENPSARGDIKAQGVRHNSIELRSTGAIMRRILFSFMTLGVATLMRQWLIIFAAGVFVL